MQHVTHSYLKTAAEKSNAVTRPYLVKLRALAPYGVLSAECNPFISRDGLPSISLPWQEVRAAIPKIAGCCYDDTVVIAPHFRQRLAEELDIARTMTSAKYLDAKVVLVYTHGYTAKVPRAQQVILSPSACRALATLIGAERGECSAPLPDVVSQVGACQRFFETCNGAAGELYVSNRYSTLGCGQLRRKFVTLARPKPAAANDGH